MLRQNRAADAQPLEETMFKQWIAGCVALVLALGLVRPVIAESPTTAPVEAAPEAKGVSPEAQAELDLINAAYAQLKTLTLAGTVLANFDVAGQQMNEKSEFTSTFYSPNKFRHAMKDDVVIGSTGETAYLYHPGENVYLTGEAKADKALMTDLPGPMSGILRSQNPSLLFAAVEDGDKAFLSDGESVTRGADVELGGQAFTSLQFNGDHGQLVLLVDKQSHLVRQAQFDMKTALEQSGQPDVKTAQVTVDYTQSDAAAPVDEATFAWAPPAGAKDLSKQVAGGDESALKGQAAPDFTLNDLEDKPVKLSDLKGSVVVLDFWATWCGPCVASMPNLQKLYEEKSADGLRVYAVNLQEEKAQVTEFLKSKNLTLPVLLDTKGEVGNQYQVQSIPFTLIVGKDGVVKEVLVGFGEDTEKRLHDAVDSAMKE